MNNTTTNQMDSSPGKPKAHFRNISSPEFAIVSLLVGMGILFHFHNHLSAVKAFYFFNACKNFNRRAISFSPGSLSNWLLRFTP